MKVITNSASEKGRQQGGIRNYAVWYGMFSSSMSSVGVISGPDPPLKVHGCRYGYGSDILALGQRERVSIGLGLVFGGRICMVVGHGEA